MPGYVLFNKKQIKTALYTPFEDCWASQPVGSVNFVSVRGRPFDFSFFLGGGGGGGVGGEGSQKKKNHASAIPFLENFCTIETQRKKILHKLLTKKNPRK